MKIKWGMYITDGVGKLGGHVVQRNHYGSFVRTLVIPSNPQTAFQQDRRTAHEFLTTNWRVFSDAERKAWSDDSANYPRTDALGDTYFSTGLNHYISLNLNLWLCGEAFITAPGTKRISTPDTGALDGVLADGSSCLFKFDVTPTDTNARVVFYLTDGISPGINYVSTKYRSIFVFTPDGATSSIDMTTNYFAVFPTPAIDTKVFCKYVFFDALSGAWSLPNISSVLVT